MAEKERFCVGLKACWKYARLDSFTSGICAQSPTKVHLRCRCCLHCADRTIRIVEDESPIACAKSRFEYGDDNRCGGATEGEVVARRSMVEWRSKSRT